MTVFREFWVANLFFRCRSFFRCRPFSGADLFSGADPFSGADLFSGADIFSGADLFPGADLFLRLHRGTTPLPAGWGEDGRARGQHRWKPGGHPAEGQGRKLGRVHPRTGLMVAGPTKKELLTYRHYRRSVTSGFKSQSLAEAQTSPTKLSPNSLWQHDIPTTHSTSITIRPKPKSWTFMSLRGMWLECHLAWHIKPVHCLSEVGPHALQWSGP